MKVFGLQGSVYRFARVASRLTAQTSAIAAVRRDALQRFDRARRDGLTAVQATRAVGVPRSTLYRWRARIEPRSRRPHRFRSKSWPSDLVRAVERLRLDFPMWGRAKIGPLVRAEGIRACDRTVGRIIAQLVQRGVVQPVPALRRRPRSHRWSARRHHAVRLPKGLKPDRPGGLVQIDTVFVTLAPGRAIKHFTASTPSPSGRQGDPQSDGSGRQPVPGQGADRDALPRPGPPGRWRVGVQGRLRAGLQGQGPRPLRAPAQAATVERSLERCNGAWRYEFYETYDLPTSLEALNPILDSFQHLYNHHRPHGALAGLTPAAYLAKRQAGEIASSHMC